MSVNSAAAVQMPPARAAGADPNAQGWLDIYNDRMQRMQAAQDPGLKQHYQAELAVIQQTLSAMGLTPAGTPETDSPEPPPYVPTDGIEEGEGPPAPENSGTGDPGCPEAGGPTKPPAGTPGTPSPEPPPPSGGALDPYNKSGKYTRRKNVSVKDIEKAVRNIAKRCGENIPNIDKNAPVIAQAIDAASKDANVDQYLLAGAIMAESRFQIGVAGNDGLGSIGLLQVIPETCRAMGIDPAKRTTAKADVTAGARYFASMLNKYNGNITYTLDAYNGGPNNYPPRQNPAVQVDYDVTVKKWMNMGMGG